jgi:hypothetical protein
MSHLWNELHSRAIKFTGTDDNLFLNTWSAKIPNFEGGCKCRSFYTLWRRQNPPNFAKYFEWTVNLHNAVNTKLRKPTISLEEAHAKWKQ